MIPRVRWPRFRQDALSRHAGWIGVGTLLWMGLSRSWEPGLTLVSGLLAFSSVWTAAGPAAARRRAEASVLACLVLGTALNLLAVSSAPPIGRWVHFGLALGGGLLSFTLLRRSGRGTARPPESSLADPSAPPALTSLVLLLAQPRSLDETALRQIAGEAWGDYHDGSVERESPAAFLLRGSQGTLRIHNLGSPYWPDLPSAGRQVSDPRRRAALLAHQAWIGVDFVAPPPASAESAPTEGYGPVIRLIVELADPEDTLAIFRPETGQLNLWNDAVFATLVGRDGLERFSEDSSLPESTVRVREDDERVREATRQARDRWPEFLAAFRHRRPGDLFTVKSPVTENDRTECIWIHVQAVTRDQIHGTLANHPVDLGPLCFGSGVSVPAAHLADWAYRLGDADEGPVVGLFTVAALRQTGQRPPEYPFLEAD